MKERLTERGIILEEYGIVSVNGNGGQHNEVMGKTYDFSKDGCFGYEDAVSAFKDLWNSIYKNWNDNPWVWVIEFKVVK